MVYIYQYILIYIATENWSRYKFEMQISIMKRISAFEKQYKRYLLRSYVTDLRMYRIFIVVLHLTK